MRAWCGRSRAVLALTVAAATLSGVSGDGAASAAPRSPSPNPYVVNGGPTTITDYPYVAGVLRRSFVDPYVARFCGGSVVAPTIVITAAHCVYDRTADSLDVLTGATHLEVGEGTRTEVAEISVHPGWDDETNQHDLALLHLAAPVAAPPIAVIPPGYEGLWAPPAQAATAGWGCTAVVGSSCDSGGFPVDLRSGALRLRTDADCAALLGDAFDAGSMRCAGERSPNGSAVDSCGGDSGGPLRVQRSGLPPMLVGVVSWGYACGYYPGAYTRLERYRTWMRTEGVPIPSTAFVGAATDNVTTTHDRPFVGDFDGDGRDDQFLYGTGAGADRLRFGVGADAGGFAEGPPVNVGGNFTPLPGDFDGDGDTDILWYRPGDATEALWRASPSGFSLAPAPTVTRSYQPAVGDFDGDARDDIFWYDPAGERNLVWFGRRARFAPGPLLAPPLGAAATALDVDGDGADDIYFDLPEPTPDELWLGDEAGFAPSPAAVTIPGSGALFVGDFDGDGCDDGFRDLAQPAPDELWRGASDAQFTRRSHPRQLGSARPGLVGDFDGDGRTDVFWYRSGSPVEVWWRGR